jgi:hypothetical protein
VLLEVDAVRVDGAAGKVQQRWLSSAHELVDLFDGA